jgi:hypothetical protein
MEILSPEGWPAATMLWEDLDGRPRMTVIAKATWAIGDDGEVRPHPDPYPIFEGDVPWEDERATSVRFETDRVPFKPRADVVLVGAARAPGGRPRAAFDAALRVGRLEKRVRVTGDRRWIFPTVFHLIPRRSAPRPVREMELAYERAYGGIDTKGASFFAANLAGRGHAGKRRPGSLHRTPLPNLEDPRHPVRSWKSRPAPAGFAFYGRGWAPRLALAGTWDDRWRKTRAPRLPEDFSFAYFNGAHPDLQVEGYLGGGEDVELTNIAPADRVRFRLPAARVTVALERWSVDPLRWADQRSGTDPEQPPRQPAERNDARFDTLVLVPGEGRFYTVFRAVFELPELSVLGIAAVRVEVDAAGVRPRAA